MLRSVSHTERGPVRPGVFTMTRDQVRFLISGILFGFLLGFLIAYGVYEPRVVEHAAPVPAAGNQGMGGGPESGAAPQADEAQPGPGGAAGGSAEQTMARVFEEVN